jgi:hypothetical protein
MGRFLDRIVRGHGRLEEPAEVDPEAEPEAPDEATAAPSAGEPQRPSDAPPPGAQTDAPPVARVELSPQAKRAIGQLKALAPDDLAALAGVDGPVKRLVEEELTRRQAVAQRQLAERGQQTRLQQRQALIAQEQTVRETDAYAAARLRDQVDAMQAQDDFLANMVKAYDRVSLDPLLLALPEAERTALLEAMPPSMDGRKYVTEHAVQRIKANEAKRLLRSPAFRKQVLASMRGEPVTPDGSSEDDEPELGADRRSSGPRPRDGKSPMDALIRRGFGQRVG